MNGDKDRTDFRPALAALVSPKHPAFLKLEEPMPYGKVSATIAETEDGRDLTIRVQLPAAGEPAKSGNSDNMTDPNEWTDVLDEFGMQTEMQLRLNVTVPYRRAARLRRGSLTQPVTSHRLVRRPM